jgi:hypothetical protein
VLDWNLGREISYSDKYFIVFLTPPPWKTPRYKEKNRDIKQKRKMQILRTETYINGKFSYLTNTSAKL